MKPQVWSLFISMICFLALYLPFLLWRVFSQKKEDGSAKVRDCNEPVIKNSRDRHIFLSPPSNEFVEDIRGYIVKGEAKEDDAGKNKG